MPRPTLRTILALASAGALIAVALPSTSMAASADTILSTKLKGANEVPGPGDPDGKGEFSAVLSAKAMCYSFAIKKIGKATMAHIHEGTSDVSGPVRITLKLPTVDGVSDCLLAVPDAEDTAVTLSVSELAALKSTPEKYYVNAHTADFGAGAVRGQL